MALGQHDRGAADQRTRDRDALALAAGELARTEVGTIGEPHPGERLGRALDGARRRRRRRRAGRRRRSRGRGVLAPGRTAERRTRYASHATWRAHDRTSPPASRPVIETTPELGRSSVPITCSSVVLPEPDGPDDRHELALSHREAHFPQRVHGRLGAVDLADPSARGRPLPTASRAHVPAPPRAARRTARPAHLHERRRRRRTGRR